ncbi:transcriptional regulator AfsR [Streptomyces sannanensis]|uniref:Transcriptional regulator AfsR n=1 Tax=Streptomyces sannanensis TaxID=285536 RepID=A0ABP6SDD2_9ACTN
MRFGLIGPPVVLNGAGSPQPLTSPKVRALLATLLLRPNRVVPVADLKDAMWGDEPPRSAHASLHNHVTRLRRILAEDDRLRAVPSGYLLRVEQGELDIEVFDASVRSARVAHSAGDWQGVAADTRTALELWRGAPMSGLPAEAVDLALVQRLDEARLLALEWRYDAELQLGRYAALGPELAALIAEFPLREAFHRQLMLALHRSGRQAEALAAFQSLRLRLVKELGVDPGSAVQEAYQEVLRTPPVPRPAGPGGAAGDDGRTGGGMAAGAVGSAGQPGGGGSPVSPGCPESAAEPGETVYSPPRPAQLPPAPAHFTGREATVRAIRAALTSPASKPPAAVESTGRPSVAVISGMAGVGKSALAAHIAHAIGGEFPDGQLYFNLHGHTPGMTPLAPAQALAAMLCDLGVDTCRIPDEPDAAAAMLRSTLVASRVLLVLDDAASAAQVRPLLPAASGCAVIVTSRSPLTALDGADRFPLAPLSAAESGELLRSVAGRDLHQHADRIAELCGRLPLALRVVAARLAARHALTAGTMAGLLDAEDGRLDHLEYDDLSVRRSLAVAHDALDPDAALALRRLGTLDLAEYEAPVVARLMDTDERRASAALDRLADVALLEEVAYGRFAPHDLVRHFARELAVRHDAYPVRAAATERALRWYAEAVRQASLAVVRNNGDGEKRLPPPIGDAAPFASTERAFAWGDRELANLATLTEKYARSSPTVLLLVRSCFPLFQNRGRFPELRCLNQQALDAARASRDPRAEAYALADLAGAYFLCGRWDTALALNDEALALWRRLGEGGRVQRCLGNRGMLLESLGRYEAAAEALEQSLEYARRLGDERGEAIVLSHLGNLMEHQDPRQAIEYHARSLAVGERLGSVQLRRTALTNIGYAHIELGEPYAAVRHFEASLDAGKDGDWPGEAQARIGLARALRRLGRAREAEVQCLVLLERCAQRCDGYAEGLTRGEYGHVLRARGDRQAARQQWRLGLAALNGTDEKAVAELKGLLDSE